MGLSEIGLPQGVEGGEIKNFDVVRPQSRPNTHFALLTILLRKRGLLSLVELFWVEKARKSKD